MSGCSTSGMLVSMDALWLGLGPGSELADPRERKYGVGAPFSCSVALSLLQPGPLEGLLSPGPGGGGLPLSYSSTRGTQWKRKCRLSPPSVILFCWSVTRGLASEPTAHQDRDTGAKAVPEEQQARTLYVAGSKSKKGNPEAQGFLPVASTHSVVGRIH